MQKSKLIEVKLLSISQMVYSIGKYATKCGYTCQVDQLNEMKIYVIFMWNETYICLKTIMKIKMNLSRQYMQTLLSESYPSFSLTHDFWNIPQISCLTFSWHFVGSVKWVSSGSYWNVTFSFTFSFVYVSWVLLCASQVVNKMCQKSRQIHTIYMYVPYTHIHQLILK